MFNEMQPIIDRLESYGDGMDPPDPDEFYEAGLDGWADGDDPDLTPVDEDPGDTPAHVPPNDRRVIRVPVASGIVTVEVWQGCHRVVNGDI